MNNPELSHAATRYRQGQEYFKELFKNGNLPACSGGYVSGNCPTGHRYAAPYLCGKEYCRDCGKDGSPIHSRRFTRWHELIKDFGRVGYFVFTFPPTVRHFFTDKSILRDYRYQLRRLLCRLGFKQGLARWHWFGDCEHCKGKGCVYCNNTGAGNFWHPHLNVLLPGIGYLPTKKLNEILETLHRWNKLYLIKLLRNEREILQRAAKSIDWNNSRVINEKIELNLQTVEQIKKDKTVINYSYTNNELEIINIVKYVTRSTFRSYIAELKEDLHNYRNAVRWGFKPKKGLLIEAPDCPACLKLGLNHKIQWTHRDQFNNNIPFISYENGIYQTSTPGQIHGGGNTDNHFIKPPPGALTRNTTKLFTRVQG
jgi:hypothetical protein